MGAVCFAPILVSLLFVALDADAKSNQALIGSLGALFGFLLGLVAVFCGVMLPLSSIGLSGQHGNGSTSLMGTVGLSAGVAALVAVVISYMVTRGLARSMARREQSQ